jgi:hypothetical protein
MSKKPSLKFLNGNEYLQQRVTNQALLFAQLTMAEAKKNSLTRDQVIKDATWEPHKGTYMGRKVTVERKKVS